MEKFPNTVFFMHSDPGVEIETDDEAPSLVDMPITDKMKKKRSSIEPWKLVINACKRVLRSSSSGKEPDFEFSPYNSFSEGGSVEICLADELFYEGRLLPLSTSLSSKSINSLSSSNSGSMNSVSSQVMAAPCLSRCRTFSSFSFKWQRFTRGLLNIPPSSSPPFSTPGLHKSQQHSRISSSLSSSSSSSSSSRSLSRKRVPSGQSGESRDSSESVRQRAEKRKHCRILWGIGNSCSDCVVITATHLVKYEQ